MNRAELAKKIGEELAAKAFQGRKGHGGGEIASRVMRQEELAAWLEGAAKLALELASKAIP